MDFSTHTKGHWLDLMLVRDDSELFKDPQLVDIGLSDHKVVKSRAFISKPQPEIILRNVRNTKEIDTTFLAQELSDIQPQDGNPDEMAEYYNCKLSEIFDIHSPLREKRVVVQPNTSWYNASIQHQKVLKRRLE